MSAVALMMAMSVSAQNEKKFLNESNDGGDLVATMNYARSYLGIILFMIPR